MGSCTAEFLRTSEEVSSGSRSSWIRAGRAFLFLEFVRDVFKQVDMQYLEKLYPELEKHIKLKMKTRVVRGRPDAFLGNFIIEFRQKLAAASLEEPTAGIQRLSLSEFVSDLKIGCLRETSRRNQKA